LGTHELIDLSADICVIDVDSFICEVLLVDVLSAKMKIDPDSAELQRIRLPKPAPMAIKLESEPGQNKRQKPAGHMDIHPKSSKPSLEQNEATAICASVSAGVCALPFQSLALIASFSTPPTVYMLCLSSPHFHTQIESGGTGSTDGVGSTEAVLLATALLRESLLANLAKVFKKRTRHMPDGLSIDGLRSLHEAVGSGIAVSGSVMVQAVLGVDFSPKPGISSAYTIEYDDGFDGREIKIERDNRDEEAEEEGEEEEEEIRLEKGNGTGTEDEKSNEPRCFELGDRVETRGRHVQSTVRGCDCGCKAVVKVGTRARAKVTSSLGKISSATCSDGEWLYCVDYDNGEKETGIRRELLKLKGYYGYETDDYDDLRSCTVPACHLMGCKCKDTWFRGRIKRVRRWDDLHDFKNKEMMHDVDLFCTTMAAPSVRSYLVGCGYWLAGFPDDYEATDDHERSTASLVHSAIQQVECYAPAIRTKHIDERNSSNGHISAFDDDVLHVDEHVDRPSIAVCSKFGEIDAQEYELACKYGADVDVFYGFPDSSKEPVGSSNTHAVECLPGTKLPYQGNLKRKKCVDLVVGESECTEAIHLLDSFDIIICKCSFDGQKFRIPDPHLTFAFQTKMEPARQALMDSFCETVVDGNVQDTDFRRQNTDEETHPLFVMAKSGLLSRAGVIWEPDNSTHYPWYQNFFARLFHRHKKYADRGIEFADHEAHLRFMQMAEKITVGDTECLIMDIGVFGEHTGEPGVDFLSASALQSGLLPNTGEANRIILALGAELEHAETPFVVRVPSGAEAVLWTKARQALICFMDHSHQKSEVPDHDLKIDLTQQQLQQLIGVPLVQQLVRYFPRKISKIKLRRCAAHGQCINPHLDHALCTMQVALNDDTEYDGGRLVCITREGFHFPRRPAGTVTIHDNTVVHGVTQMRGAVCPVLPGPIASGGARMQKRGLCGRC
jgi:hypothetical protein